MAVFVLLALVAAALMAATGPATGAPLVTTSAVSSTAAADGAPARAAYSATTVAPETYERRVQRRVNRVRADHGLRPLRLHACADRVAERWSRHLAGGDGLYHQSMQSVLVECDAGYAGETLGRGAVTPRRLVRMWMNSPGHRAILVSPSPTRIGIGAHADAQGHWVTAASFLPP